MDEKFHVFLKDHHVLNLATCKGNLPYTCSCFYAFDAPNGCFIFASDPKTRHIQEALENPNVAGTVTLETKSVGLIQGMQFTGHLTQSDKTAYKLYYKAYPFARAMRPTLWTLRIDYAKLTDNRLGFGKKLEFYRP
ncbi:MAG: pyridoxamine 5'-phosphate oxidase family protein [Campylobacterales bacterium]|nr:pyridoxamine 5'-phosphate oxidase family protein [Campylobacterales bacterium]